MALQLVHSRVLLIIPLDFLDAGELETPGGTFHQDSQRWLWWLRLALKWEQGAGEADIRRFIRVAETGVCYGCPEQDETEQSASNKTENGFHIPSSCL